MYDVFFLFHALMTSCEWAPATPAAGLPLDVVRPHPLKARYHQMVPPCHHLKLCKCHSFHEFNQISSVCMCQWHFRAMRRQQLPFLATAFSESFHTSPLRLRRIRTNPSAVKLQFTSSFGYFFGVVLVVVVHEFLLTWERKLVLWTARKSCWFATPVWVLTCFFSSVMFPFPKLIHFQKNTIGITWQETHIIENTVDHKRNLH